jgi:hypothetical protein
VSRLPVLAAAVVLLGAAACTADGDRSGASGPPAGSAAAPSSDPAEPSAPEPTPPTLAGSAEARALAPLPAGPAGGTVVLGYAGVGEVREPFEGECSHAGDATIIEGTADTASIRLEVAPDGARLALDDIGLSATSGLTTGRYEVAGGHLSLAAGLAQDGQPVGTVELEIDCG